jgi:hypothetical protein
MCIAYALTGLVGASWASRGWPLALVTVAGYFYLLGRVHFGADYYPETFWDHAGRPTAEQVFVALLGGGATWLGWWLGRRARARVTPAL